MVTENTAPNAAADVEMSQYVADRTRVNEDKIKKDDEIISQFGDYNYGWHDSDAAGEAAKRGIDENVVRAISADKGEPQWMLDLRLKSLEIFNRFPDPTWGPSIEGLDMDNIVTYVKPNTDQKHDWESVPDDIKNTFERLGIPDAERSYLAGVGAQYDSELVYHNMQDTASKMGIVYSGIEEALHDPQWEPLIHEKFMTLIPPTDH